MAGSDASKQAANYDSKALWSPTFEEDEGSDARSESRSSSPGGRSGSNDGNALMAEDASDAPAQPPSIPSGLTAAPLRQPVRCFSSPSGLGAAGKSGTAMASTYAGVSVPAVVMPWTQSGSPSASPDRAGQPRPMVRPTFSQLAQVAMPHASPPQPCSRCAQMWPNVAGLAPVAPGGAWVGPPVVWPSPTVVPPPPTPRGACERGASPLPGNDMCCGRAGDRHSGSPPPPMRNPVGTGSPPPPMRNPAGTGSGSLSVPPPRRPSIPGAVQAGYMSPNFPAGPSRLGERSTSPQGQLGRSVSLTRRHFRQLWVLEREEHILVDVTTGAAASHGGTAPA